MDYMEYYCKKCNYQTNVKRNWNLHIRTKKHLKDKRKKEVFYCEVCDYRAKCRQNLYSHNKTIKHKDKVKRELERKELRIREQEREELQRMKDKLKYFKMAEHIRVLEEKLENERKLREKDLALKQKKEELKKTQEELKKTLIEQNKVMSNTLRKAVENSGTTIKNTNCGNKTININVFLKEKCKDAMNLEDFVNRLTVGMDDIKYAINNGGSEAISRLLIKNLQDLPPTDRPIHCADEKRSKFYIKDKKDGWGKESSDPKNSSLNWQLSRTQHKFCDFVREWTNKNEKGVMANRGSAEAFWSAATIAVYGMRDNWQKTRKKIRRQVAPEVLLREARNEAEKIMKNRDTEELGDEIARQLATGFDPERHMDKNKVMENIKISTNY